VVAADVRATGPSMVSVAATAVGAELETSNPRRPLVGTGIEVDVPVDGEAASGELAGSVSVGAASGEGERPSTMEC
jgi:hypothetical protein